jgi:hypothetical protein
MPTRQVLKERLQIEKVSIDGLEREKEGTQLPNSIALT